RLLGELEQLGYLRRRVWLLRHAIVVWNPDGAVLLLNPETLATITHLSDKHKAIAADRSSSTVVLLHATDGMVFLQVCETGVVHRQTTPFPNAANVRGLALLPSGSVLFSTDERSGLYQLRPPYKSPELIAGSTSFISSIEIDQSETAFITHELGGIGAW